MNADESSWYTEEKITFDTRRQSTGELDHFFGGAKDENVEE